MKLVTPILALFVSVSAMAQSYYAELDPARRAEIEARNNAYGPGYVTPGNADVYQPHRPPPPPRPRPPRPLPPPGGYYPPPPPPPAPGYGDVGPQVTVRWQDNGVTRLPKLVSQTITVYVGNVLTNEVLVRAIDNRVGIESALAYLAALQGSIGQNGELRSFLDYRFSLRVNRIEIRATSPNLIGSRGQVQILVGLAQN